MSRPLRILIVDDVADIRDVIGLAAASGTDTLAFAESVSSALRLFEAGARYDVLITDLVMGKENGLQLIQAVERFEPRPAIAVFSAFLDRDLVEIAQDLGAEAVFQKPADLSKIRRFVEEVRRALTPPPPARG